MKDNFFLYSVCLFAIVGILVCFIAYATTTLPMHITEQTPVFKTVVGKKKNCKCCADRLERVRKVNKDLIERYPMLKKALTATEHETE